ncbi:hypothetical protein A2276_06350 [candidate division WOR-1 bacterium RIFOXYA12_FULL_43_27]|uniref:histidine kinase n=1 Tax=candidate division WOR-1 bacterium RIFOXYC2_FULL_46_14 TaxID=1802587 RepID=A0A1F4U5M4_UNCSA|nr:MAG: hypothetical protein A2276_06350 [candidate division WOR-1 bacterium RIFOXYA12_FULL_43_27]OGC20273.1 MAG: hypothetical protein A2292_04350 [candidate division WOR-1 bacterium RIFOXYB2_FULL_46_45]OGC31990.1 MAG: hypothetical protein A2232_07100 [candidate division WOR-1 bacterium RIFOXYA2_FULL_46_56]OGC40120.1 MAG: hypothetical protein A2438_02370 [candidate division WOR-1 bacterium RIFOXYC2_FULL_46_14]
MQKDDPLVKFLKKTRRPVVLEEITLELESVSNPDFKLLAVKNELEKIKAAVCVPLFAEDRLIGVLALGEKTNHEMYTDDDIDFLNTVSNQLAVALERARLHQEMIAAERQLLQADKLSSLGTVAAGMAHEIKNPLASIKGMTEIVVKAFEKNDREALEDFKKVVPKELDRISNLIQNLLAYSKPTKPNKLPVDLNEIVENILKLFEMECMKGNITVKMELGTVSKKDLDPELMRQVFTNLILNAIQAMPDGGQLCVGTNSDAGQLAVEVSDNGTGIPEDKIKNIFDPFFTTKEKGAGLGLAISYKIVREHGGTITVKSKPGEGTVFTVLL